MSTVRYASMARDIGSLRGEGVETLPPRVLLSDVAAAAGVSLATASRALSGSKSASPQAAAAVAEAALRLGYRPNRVAQAMRAQSTGLVGLVVPGVANPFFSGLIEALEMTLYHGDLEMILCDSRGSVEEERRRVETLVDRKVDGLIVIPTDYERSAASLRWAQGAGPVVQVDRQVPGLAADYVGVDNGVGIRALLAHLAGAGARRIAFVSDEGHSSTGRGRLDAFESEIRRFPILSTDPHLLGEFSVDFGRQAARRLLRRRQLPDAVLCGADLIALGVVRELAEHGVRAPDAVLVTGFDGVVFTEFSDPPITTVCQPVEAIARAVVELLDARLGGDTSPPHRHEIAPTLSVRRSSTR